MFERPQFALVNIVFGGLGKTINKKRSFFTSEKHDDPIAARFSFAGSSDCNFVDFVVRARRDYDNLHDFVITD